MSEARQHLPTTQLSRPSIRQDNPSVSQSIRILFGLKCIHVSGLLQVLIQEDEDTRQSEERP